jgi:hypothetical protein
MFSVQQDEVDKVSDSLKENVEPQLVKNSASSSLNNNSNSNSTTSSSSSSSATITKRYLSKFKKEWLSNPKYSSFLKECKNDTTKALCIICNIQFSIQNSGITDVNNHMKSKRHQDCLKSAESNKCNVFPTNFNKKIFLVCCFSL